MKFYETVFLLPQENIDADEQLLRDAEQAVQENWSDNRGESFRVWESSETFVVLGRSSKESAEVNRDACAEDGVAVVRRSSGGLSIVTGPGCLMYAVTLRRDLHPSLKTPDAMHSFVLARIREAVHDALDRSGSPLVPQQEGFSDLAIDRRKFSGNSLRFTRNAILYHGTLLYNFRLEDIDRYLQHPPKMPEYRKDRSHDAFVMNLPLTAEALTESLRALVF